MTLFGTHPPLSHSTTLSKKSHTMNKYLAVFNASARARAHTCWIFSHFAASSC